MHARRRNIGHDSEKEPLVTNDPNNYTKLDKKGGKPYYNSISSQSNSTPNHNFIKDGASYAEDLHSLLFEEEIVTEVVMASRDRTNEFAAAVRSLQGNTLARPNVRDDRKALVLQSYSQFMNSAKIISRNISSTYAKLEKLALLAKKKSLFDDRPAEIQELTYIIKGDLSSLNQQIARLGDMPRGQRTLRNHSSSVVLALQSRLASMSTHFKQVLEVRSENLRHQNNRREQFTRGIPPVQDESNMLLRQDDVMIDFGESSSLQTQQFAMRDDSDTYVAQRAETMHNIESTIVELGGIFQQLAHMVKEQDEVIGRIDANIEDAEMNIEAAHSQILKHFQSVTGNRALMLKIFAVLIFFFIFFVVVMA